MLIEHEPGGVRLTVTDDGRGSASWSANEFAEGGNGLPGMHERAVALGGELAAGPGPGQGFEVRARLPRDGARSAAPRDTDPTDRSPRTEHR